MDKIVYKLGELERPSNSKIESFILKINKIPVIRNLDFIKRLVCKSFNMPVTTTFNEGFYCSAPIIQVGNNVGLADTFILAYAPVIIGDNCSFSFRNMIITSTHDLNDFSTVIAQPVIIGNNVWITTNVTILPGVVIGDNAVIGAGSVVSKSIPSGVFAAGNPCKVIREISFKK
jgi:maltose O-acetyltransferase